MGCHFLLRSAFQAGAKSLTRFNYSYFTSICSDLIRRKLGLRGHRRCEIGWMWGRAHHGESVVPRSIPVSVLWVEVKKVSFPMGAGAPASRTGTELARPGPQPRSLSAFPAPARPGRMRQPPPHTRGEAPSHSPLSHSIAITPQRMPEERGSDWGWPGDTCRIAPLRPFADALNAPHPGPTGSYLAAARWSTRPAGSSPGGAWAPPRRTPRAQGRTVPPARRLRTGEGAAACGKERGDSESPWGCTRSPGVGGHIAVADKVLKNRLSWGATTSSLTPHTFLSFVGSQWHRCY